VKRIASRSTPSSARCDGFKTKRNGMNGNGRQGIGTMVVASALGMALAACESSGAPEKDAVAKAMQASMQGQLTTLWTASKALRDAAPAPRGRGWDETMDAAALDAMKAAWKNARDAYEHVEGATAPIFFDIDVAIDERYDGFLAVGPDTDLFDDQGVTGMHAIERILYADVTPPGVVAFEMPLPGYEAAAWPTTEQEAAEFKNKLCARLVTDTKTLLDDWTPRLIDVSGAFDGLVSLVNEQQEKVNKAGTNAEESRYSQRTMADLRANLAGTVAIYQVFRAWLKTKPAKGSTPSGVDVDTSITAGLDAWGRCTPRSRATRFQSPPRRGAPSTPTRRPIWTPRSASSTRKFMTPLIPSSPIRS
jgi:iron uptake system component EfeO